MNAASEQEVPNTSKSSSICTVPGLIRLLVGCALLTAVATPQPPQNRAVQEPSALVKERLPDAMRRLKQGDFFNADIGIIADAGAVQAIPDLKKQFELAGEPSKKDFIASALIRCEGKTVAGTVTGVHRVGQSP